MSTIAGSPAAARAARVLDRLTGPLVGGPVGVARSLVDVLLAWQERAARRHALGHLDDRMLKDIGLSRADIQAETAKPFWRA